MKHSAMILAALAAMAASLCSCEKKWPYEGDDFNNVVIYYGCGYNNLSSAISTNVDELCSGAIPDRKSHDALLAFCHTTDSYGDYSTKHAPVLIRMYTDKKGIAVRDTLMTYTADTRSVDEGTLNTVLSSIKRDFPAKHYGFIFSSHSTGWIPPGYTRSDERKLSSAASIRDLNEQIEADELNGQADRRRPAGTYQTMPQSPGFPETKTTSFPETKNTGFPETKATATTTTFPETKSIGAQYSGSSSSAYMMELVAFANAIPMKLDYIIFDSCLMGCIETAYELKDVCDKIVFSPTEILKQGLMYPPMAGHLLRYPTELQAICEEYYDYYTTDAQTKAATIALVDCSKADAVASDMATIIENHRSDLYALTENDVQRYWYNESNNSKHWFYDLRDIAKQAGATQSELSKLDSDLSAMVTYKAATPTFFNLTIEPARYSGLSMYLPTLSWDTLNDYYKTLSWNKKVNLVK